MNPTPTPCDDVNPRRSVYDSTHVAPDRNIPPARSQTRPERVSSIYPAIPEEFAEAAAPAGSCRPRRRRARAVPSWRGPRRRARNRHAASKRVFEPSPASSLAELPLDNVDRERYAIEAPFGTPTPFVAPKGEAVRRPTADGATRPSCRSPHFSQRDRTSAVPRRRRPFPIRSASWPGLSVEAPLSAVRALSARRECEPPPSRRSHSESVPARAIDEASRRSRREAPAPIPESNSRAIWYRRKARTVASRAPCSRLGAVRANPTCELPRLRRVEPIERPRPKIVSFLPRPSPAAAPNPDRFERPQRYPFSWAADNVDCRFIV